MKKYVIPVANCAQTAALDDDFSKLGPGEIRVIDEKGAIVTNVTVAKAKSIRFVYGTGSGRYSYGPIITKGSIKHVSTAKARNHVDGNVVFGDNGSGVGILANATKKYKINLKYKEYTNSDILVDYTASASFVKDETKHVDLFLQLVSMFVDNMKMNDRTNYSVALKTSATTAPSTSVIRFKKGSTTAIVNSGSIALGDMIVVSGYAYVATSIIGNQIELSSPFVTDSVTATNAAIVAAATVATTDKIGIVITHTSQVGDFSMKMSVMHDPEIGYDGFVKSQVHITKPVYPVGEWRHVTRQYATFGPEFKSDMTSRDENILSDYATVKTGDRYSSISIQYKTTATSAAFTEYEVPLELCIYLSRGSAVLAENNAGTNLLTNILTGTGLAAANATSFLNVLNAFLVANANVSSGANTKANGGNEITGNAVLASTIDV